MKITWTSSVVFLTVAFASCKLIPSETPPAHHCTPAPSAPAAARLFAGNDRARIDSSGLARLASHVPPVVKQFADRGKMDDEAELSVLIELSLNREVQLDSDLSEMYRPGSENYHRFVTPQEFRTRYSPTDAQIAQATAYLQSHGLATTVNENGFLIRAMGTAGAFGRALATEVHHYADADGQAYFSPAYDLKVPVEIPIRAVHGLQNVTRWKSHAVSGHSMAHSGIGSGPGGGLSPTDVRTAYRIPSSVNGAGQTLALFELDGYSVGDIQGYEKAFGLPAVSLTNILVGSASGQPGPGAGEVVLDIELMIAVAPGASNILVYEGTNDGQGVLDTYARIANENRARQVSTSWGAPELYSTNSFLQTENTIFKQMAAQGQTVYAASGDSGAYDNGHTLGVDDPASQPYVAGVGGTTLSLAADGTRDRESAWNTDGNPGDGGGGGGINTVWKQPDWQGGAVSANSLGSTTMRNVPDVALNANPATGYAIYFNGEWTRFGGTSCAAPIWAAFTALVNQERTAKNLSALGFANPIFYRQGKSARYASDFWDVDDGSTNMVYPAVAGYDEATGWGSFNGEGLLADLAVEQGCRE